MAILIGKSICIDCVWKDSCQKLYRLRDMCGPDNNSSERSSKRPSERPSEKPSERPVDIFDVIVKQCSLKNFDRSYRKDDSMEGMYYCPDCHAMHHGNSKVGKLHKKWENCIRR